VVTSSVDVVVSVGTDHHRFERLVDWIERWALSSGRSRTIVVQHGTSRAPAGTVSHPLLEQAELRRLMSQAAAVVVQGGPGGIIDSLGVGRRPIVVPRMAALGEHVDNHQVAFAHHVAARGLVTLVESEELLVAELDAAMSDPERFRVQAYVPESARTAERIGQIVDQLVGR
jgi:UDP-N-acetylglucosamine transferase subunit ALG13